MDGSRVTHMYRTYGIRAMHMYRTYGIRAMHMYRTYGIRAMQELLPRSYCRGAVVEASIHLSGGYELLAWIPATIMPA